MASSSRPSLRSVGALATLAAAAVLAGCSGGSPGDRDNRGDFVVNSISTGSGTIFPFRIRQADTFGNPTATVVNIDKESVMKANVSGNNGVLPVATYSLPALLPDGNVGSHFMHFKFSHKLDVDSILSNLIANQSNSGLTGALSIIDYDPATETSQMVTGRGYVNGFTYFNNLGVLEKVQAVEANGTGVTILDSRAADFPNFDGAAELVSNKSFVFVADATTGNPTFPFTFPTSGRLMRIVVTSAVLDSEGHSLEQELCTATTVGADTNPPEVLGYTTLNDVKIAPGNGQTGIDPTTTIQVRFNKPVQPGEVGSFFDPQQLTPTTGGLVLSVTAAAVTFPVIYHADPFNYGDFCNYIVRPAYNLPGQSNVAVTVQTTSIHSLAGSLIGTPITTNFSTAPGQGIVNAPVAPEAIYLGIGGSDPGVSVIDLNGIGQGTGDITNTRFRQPLQPNIGAPIFPPLAQGQTNLDAGSAGVLTLTRDTNLNTRLLAEPLVGTIGDIHIGAPLDLVFNNFNVNRNVSSANQINPVTQGQMPGNSITQAPHPNPPRLVYPPPNPARSIFGEEPTTTTSTPGPAGVVVTGGVAVGCINSPVNLLIAGNPFSNTAGSFGLYGGLNMGVFYGPQPAPASPPPPAAFCPFTSRQQVGHFLYLLDRDNRQIVVVNSNRFTILDTIRLTDPISMAMSPDMTRLAVTNFASSKVSFIDIDPTSPTFDTVVKETSVERGPTGIAYQPDGEDVLVVSTDANFMSIISSQSLEVRRTVSGFLQAPIDVVATERFQATGFAQGVYYAYILNSNGTVAVYESGPDGVNGIGFNDVIGTVPNASFPRARSMMNDYTTQAGGVLIGHVDQNGLGQVSRLVLSTSPPGQLPLNPSSTGFILPPTYRQKEWSVAQRFGGLAASSSATDLLSGNSVIDLAMDDMFNYGALPGQATTFNSAFSTTPWGHSGKHTVKPLGGGFVFGSLPRLLFVALSDVGKVDVVELSTGRKIATIDVPGVRCVSNYWRQ